MPAGLAFHIDYLANAVQLQVVNKPFFSADFDEDGDVDPTDFAIWHGAFNLNQLGDADGDNDSDAATSCCGATSSAPCRAAARRRLRPCPSRKPWRWPPAASPFCWGGGRRGAGGGARLRFREHPRDRDRSFLLRHSGTYFAWGNLQ